MPDDYDRKLVADFLGGREEALEVLIGQYLKSIYAFVYRLVGIREDAEEITQETFVKAWRNFKKFDQKRSFKTWLYKIARNTSIDFLRKKKIVPFSDFEKENGENYIEENLIDPAPLPEEIFDRKNLADEIAAAIEKLPAKYGEVLILHYHDQFTFQEISEMLDEPADTVKTRHRRAIIALRRLLLDKG